jgi:hypothetical protein
MLALNFNQVPQWSGVGDDDHAIGSTTRILAVILFLAVGHKLRGTISLAPKIVNGILQPYAAILEKCIQLRAGRYAQKPAELRCSQAVGSIGLNGHVLKGLS